MRLQYAKNQYYDQEIAEQANMLAEQEAIIRQQSMMLNQQAETIAQLTQVCYLNE